MTTEKNTTNNIIERVLHDLTFDSLNNIHRWNAHRRIKDETVAHHCYIVALFSNFIVEELCGDSYINLKLQVSRAAIFHEKGEIFSGDLSHLVKYNEYNGEAIRREIDNYIVMKMQKEFPKNTYSNKLIRDASEYYENVVVKNIVKLADWLSSLYYVEKEISLGNTNLNESYRMVLQKTKNQCHFLISSLSEYESDVINFEHKVINDTILLINKKIEENGDKK